VAKILVTGGSGRLGQSVVRAFANAGNEVLSVDGRTVDGLPAEQRSADLTSNEATHAVVGAFRPDAIVHLAAIAVPFSAPEQTILATNTALAFNVLEAGVASSVERIVTASSPTVLGYGNPAGWLPKRFPLDETEIPRPWHAYGLSKVVAEATTRMFATASGGRTRFASFRPCYVISPEEWAGAPTQQGHTVRERLARPELSAPALFNYVDARDAADFLITLIERLADVPNGETFFVGAKDALAREPLATLLPRFVQGSEELAANLTETRAAFSIEKARSLLGWAPRHDWRTELGESEAVTEAAALITSATHDQEQH
jgi:nucleoside-diphosphate-sugar epimerase